MRATIIIVAALIGVMACILLASPGKVVVDEQGKISSGINRMRAMIQGKRFWKHQLALVDKELAELKPSKSKSVAVLQNFQNDADKIMEGVYDQLPEKKPSEVDKEARRLKEEASETGLQKMARKLEDHVAQRSAELTAIRPILVSKVEGEGRRGDFHSKGMVTPDS